MKKAFTLIEILVSIAIFSALIILSIGVFARSATSVNKANDVREQTQVTRSIIDTVATDLRYVDLKTEITFCEGVNNLMGYCYEDGLKTLWLLLKYPGEDTHTAKKYTITSNGVTVSEKRQCQNCTKSDLSSASLLSMGSLFIDENESRFTVTHKVKEVKDSGSVKISITTKNGATVDCANKKSGERCYQLNTTIVPGVY